MVKVAIALLAAVLLAVAIMVLVGAPPRCDDGKVAVMGEGKWYCVEGTEAPTRAGADK